MRITMRPVARAAAIAAIVAAPTLALGQTQPGAQPNPAADHLTAARAALNKVLTAPAPSGAAFKTLSELKTEYLALEKAASTRAPEWETHFQNVDRLAGDLLSPTPASAEAGAVGTSGTSPALAPGVDADLVKFRTELGAFKDAMKGASSPASGANTASAPASPAAAAEAPPATAPPATAPPATAPPATDPATSTTAAPAMPATSDATTVAQLDQLTATIDAMIKAAGNASSDKVTVDRRTLEGLKAQIEQIKLNVKK